MNPAYFQAAAIASSAIIIPAAGPPDEGGGDGFNFIVSTSGYTPPAGNDVNFETS